MSRSSCSILYTIFAWFLGICYGFVLLSSAAGQHGEIELFKNGESLIYQWRTTTLLSEKSANTKNVGFSITGNVVVHVLWSAGNRKLLKFQVSSLLISSIIIIFIDLTKNTWTKFGRIHYFPNLMLLLEFWNCLKIG